MGKRVEVELLRAVERLWRTRGGRWVLGILVLLGVCGILAAPLLERHFGFRLADLVPETRQPARAPELPPHFPSRSEGEEAILDAFDARQSDRIVRAEGTIARLLPDDEAGSRHQKFVLRLTSGHTVLVAHNIDLAERIPAKVGERLEFQGVYEYSEQGGVIHWTHHDPAGRHPGGWIRYRGQVYE